MKTHGDESAEIAAIKLPQAPTSQSGQAHDQLRLALISTPRCGNTWLRSMLACSLELEELAVHTPEAVDWQSLPPRIILHLHWWRDEALCALLRQHRFRVVVICRHPIDVLISLAAYVQHTRDTSGWLAGRFGDEDQLQGASPLDSSFLSYATGERARALFNIGVQWWQSPGAARMRYEDLVADPVAQMTRLLAELSAQPRLPAADVVARFSPGYLRSTSVDLQFHVWQAQPGLWKRLLPWQPARQIYRAQQAAFETFGYVCDADESLAPADAQLAWLQLELAAATRNLGGLKQKINEAEARRVHEMQHLCREYERHVAKREALARQFAETNAHFSAVVGDLHVRLNAISKALRRRTFTDGMYRPRYGRLARAAAILKSLIS